MIEYNNNITTICSHNKKILLHNNFTPCRIYSFVSFGSYDRIKFNESKWNWFEEIDDECVRCKGCKKILQRYYISTTNLIRHLKLVRKYTSKKYLIY